MMDGSVRCWGLGSFGALGLGSTEDIGDDEDPGSVAAVSIPEAVADIAATGYGTCVLTTVDNRPLLGPQ